MEAEGIGEVFSGLHVLILFRVDFNSDEACSGRPDGRPGVPAFWAFPGVHCHYLGLVSRVVEGVVGGIHVMEAEYAPIGVGMTVAS